MKNRQDYQAERRKAAEILEKFNQLACAHFADILRKHDEYCRLCTEVGQPTENLIPADYFEAAYKLLSFGPIASRATLILGTADDIEKLVSRVQTYEGFYSYTGHWIEL